MGARAMTVAALLAKIESIEANPKNHAPPLRPDLWRTVHQAFSGEFPTDRPQLRLTAAATTA